jgi:hypothetical protein
LQSLLKVFRQPKEAAFAAAEFAFLDDPQMVKGPQLILALHRSHPFRFAFCPTRQSFGTEKNKD